MPRLTVCCTMVFASIFSHHSVDAQLIHPDFPLGLGDGSITRVVLGRVAGINTNDVHGAAGYHMTVAPTSTSSVVMFSSVDCKEVFHVGNTASGYMEIPVGGEVFWDLQTTSLTGPNPGAYMSDAVLGEVNYFGFGGLTIVAFSLMDSKSAGEYFQ